jgi:hypothetical protein
MSTAKPRSRRRSGQPALEVAVARQASLPRRRCGDLGAKGTVDSGSATQKWRVDGLSGATLTSRGVTNLVQFLDGRERLWPVPQ